MIRTDIDEDITKEILLPAMKMIEQHIKENVINDFVADDIAIKYDMSTLWNSSFDFIINEAIEDLKYINSNLYDKKIIKEKLERKHGLKVVEENPFNVERI